MGMQSFAHFVTLDNSFNFLSLSFLWCQRRDASYDRWGVGMEVLGCLLGTRP